MPEQLAGWRLLQRVCHLQTHSHRHADGDFVHHRWRRHSKRLADWHRRSDYHQFHADEWSGGNPGDDYGNRFHGGDQGDVWRRCRCQLQGELGDADHGDRAYGSEDRQDRSHNQRSDSHQQDQLHGDLIQESRCGPWASCSRPRFALLPLRTRYEAIPGTATSYCTLRRLSMNDVQRTSKSLRIGTALVLAAFVVAVVMTAIPAFAQTYTDLHEFNPGAGEPNNLNYTGMSPQGWDGKLYGVSHYGGTSNIGTVFSITLNGTPAIIHSFDGTDGSYPYNGLTLGRDGNFYGVASLGGSANVGTVFKITPAGTYTVLHNFTNGSDGEQPTVPPVQGNDGNFYGTTSGGTSTFYKVTPSGSFTTLHTFASSEGNQCATGVLGSDGNFYGGCANAGITGTGTLFKISTAGHVTVLHNVTKASDGQGPNSMIQATDGNFYGAMSGGGANIAGTIFQLKTNGTYKVLYTFGGLSGTDGSTPSAGLTQGRDGSLYGTAALGGNTACNGGNGCGVIFKITTAGAYSVLYTFDSTHGSNPKSNLTLDTDGVFYGNTQHGGAHGAGVFYSLDMGFSPFITLGVTSGTVGTKVGIMGQGFSSSSVVKFGGVKATSITLTGTTYIVATVPAGAVDGYVTVTTGSTTLTSTKTFSGHNSWSIGKAMPTGTAFSVVGVIKGLMYVVGGVNSANTRLAETQIYNPATNTWTTGTSLPTATSSASAAVVNNILYVFGGTTDGTTPTNAVWAYNPTTKTWTGKAAMPTARWGSVAVVESKIYVVGGETKPDGSDPLATVESYNPATNTWTEEAPMLVAKGQPAAGLLGTTIVAADGGVLGGSTGDTEGYNATTNTWTTLAADPTARTGPCFGSISSQFYVAGGVSTTLTESFNLSKNKWTTLAPMPQSAGFPGSAAYNGQLYCFGGWASGSGPVLNNVQIYQP